MASISSEVVVDLHVVWVYGGLLGGALVWSQGSGVDSPLAVRPWTCKDFSFLHPLKNEGVGPVVLGVGGPPHPASCGRNDLGLSFLPLQKCLLTLLCF